MAEASHRESIDLEGANLTQRLVEFVIETPSSKIPTAAKSSARRLILDTIGVALLASTHPVGELVTRHADALSGRERSSSVFGGSNLVVSANMAAHANGVMANALDYDAGGHLPTHLLPALFSTGERDKRSGADVLTAFILAYEAAAALTRVIDAARKAEGGPTYRGWWHVGLVGPIAAALAVSRLQGASIEQTRRAVGIASASSAGFRRSMGTMTKALHSGNASRAGVEAVMLASEGFTSDDRIIEGPLGFVAALTSPDETDVDAIVHRLGAPFKLERFPGVKKYPAVTPSHGVISAAVEIAHRPGFDPMTINRVEADFRSFSLERKSVGTVEEAGFCAPYLIAMGLIFGAFGPRELEPARLLDPRVQALAQKVIQIPKGSDPNNLVRVISIDGRVLEARCRGERLFDAAEVERKFRLCASSAVKGEAQVDEIASWVDAFERAESLDRLMALCRGGA